jgi:hypothetical protein
MRVFEESLRRNASPDEACAAECTLLLDDRDGFTKLRRANGGDVSAGARADHNDIERFRQ